MKKLLLICFAILPLFFASCDVKKNPVKGHTYCYKSNNYTFNYVTGTTKHIIKFNTSNRGESYWLDKDGDIVKHEGTFSYSVGYGSIEIQYEYRNETLFISNGGAELWNATATYYRQR